MQVPTFKPVADHAVLVEFGTKVSDDLNQQVIALDQQISQNNIPGIYETVPALVNLLVLFDPLRTDHLEIEKHIRALIPNTKVSATKGSTHTVPICYDAELCPDLKIVAQQTELSVDAVINQHLSSVLRVSMYGFAPGFAYLSGVPAPIQVPRKPAPTRGIPRGQVMIAGPQCLITTVVMPTGWSIIGRSAIKIILDDPSQPFLFNVGDKVVFERIKRTQLPSELQWP